MAVDADLKKEVQAAQTQGRNFALVVASKNGLLLSKSQIGGDDVKAKQKECGGGSVLRGTCFGDNGVLVFATTAKFSDNLNDKVKLLIHKETGLSVEVAFRSPKAEQTNQPTDSTKPSGDAPPPTSTQQLPVDGAPKEKAPGEQGDTEADKLKTKIEQQLKKLKSLLLEACQRQPEQKAALVRLMGAAQAAAASGKADVADKAVAQLQEQIKAILKGGPPQQTTSEVAEDEPVPDLGKRIDALRSTFDKAMALSKEMKTGKDTELQALMDRLLGLQRDGKTAEAQDLVDELNAAVKGALRAALARKEVGAGTVAYKRARVRWVQGLSSARLAMGHVIDAILDHPEVANDPRIEEIKAKAQPLAGKVPTFDGKLEDALDRLEANPSGPAHDTAKKDALVALDAYQKRIDSVPELKQLENTMFGKFSLYGELTDALRVIRTTVNQ